MKTAVVFVILGILVLHALPAQADTQDSDDVAILLFIASAGVSLVNIGYMTLSDGSASVGIVGIAIGTGLVTYSLITDSLDGEDRSPFVGMGIAAAVIGAMDIIRARRKDPELLGMEVDPLCDRIDGQTRVGLQLTARW